jgi:hypothetical protein
MSSGRFGVLELLLFFGIPIAIGIQQLWSLRRERRRDERAARHAADAQGEASDGRDDGAT